jgi:UDP-N-acetylglucosamine 2-epimerase (non-hydrolysing)
MTICFILGTRPEIIKLSPVIRECVTKDIPFSLLHTGQHYSYNMDRLFFEELQLPDVTENLEVGSGTHGKQTGKMLWKIEKFLMQNTIAVSLVQGDTNTVLAGALASVKLHITTAHVEAGLRSFDRKMPEEINRIVADHVSDLLFTPTENAGKILMSEGIDPDKIFYTGNTVVDAVNQNLALSEKYSAIFQKSDVEKKKYFLTTIHRQENVDDKKNLSGILAGLGKIGEEFGLPVLFPIHPRTQKRIHEFNLDVPEGVCVKEPFGYLEFLLLEKNAKLILTDSGGVQEESCIMGVPCVTLRENTERPETLQAGSNQLCGSNPENILRACQSMINKSGWKNPFGDGCAGKKIVRVLEERMVL